METILIATDFSNASRNASFYGIRLAKLLHAKVILLNVYSYGVPSVDPAILTGLQDEFQRASSEGLANDAAWLEPLDGVDLEKRSVAGSTVPEILDEAKKVGARWIIAGMKGAGKMTRKFFGGTAYEL